MGAYKMKDSEVWLGESIHGKMYTRTFLNLEKCEDAIYSRNAKIDSVVNFNENLQLMDNIHLVDSTTNSTNPL